MFNNQVDPDSIDIIQKRALKCIILGLGYAEILRCVNQGTLKVRPYKSILSKIIL